MSRTQLSPPTQSLPTPDDGIGDFRDQSHAVGFLNFFNFLTEDLQYTIEYPSNGGSLPYIDFEVQLENRNTITRH